MKTLTPQIIAMYLGCEAKWGNTSVTWQLIGIGSTHEGLQTPLLKDKNRDYVCSVPISSIKLLLRPLSSMTEEEMKECKQMVIAHSGTRKFGDDGKRHIGKGFLGVKMTVYDSDFLITKFLLSKHFDLFNLIENGLAIDSTQTIKTP